MVQKEFQRATGIKIIINKFRHKWFFLHIVNVQIAINNILLVVFMKVILSKNGILI